MADGRCGVWGGEDAHMSIVEACDAEVPEADCIEEEDDPK